MAFVPSLPLAASPPSATRTPGRPPITMTSDTPTTKKLHIETPLVRSVHLSEAMQTDVFLKLDNMQPGGSFKIRGHGHLVSTHFADGKRHFISSSGGNAGMAVAIAGQALGTSVTIVVPESTPAFMVQRLRRVGARVVVHGAVWDVADVRAREMTAADASAVHVSPFDDALLWQGHATLVDEVRAQLGGARRPAAIVVSVGGGGLFLGVAAGLRRAGWGDVPIVAAETAGANCFAEMVHAGGKVVKLEGISSIAKSLGALAVSQKCADFVSGGGRFQSVVVSDREAVEACSMLAVQHRVLVEPACGAAVAAVRQMDKGGDAPIVVVVCGGSMASPSLLGEWVKATGATETAL